jgi:hypothetical protein
MLFRNSLLWDGAAEIAVPAARTSTFTSSAIDLTGVKGKVAVVVHSNNGTGNADNTMIPKIQVMQADGTTYADVTSGIEADLITVGTDKGARVTTLVMGTVTNAAGGKMQVLIFDVRDLPVKPAASNQAAAVGPSIKLVCTIAGTTPSFVFGASWFAIDEYPTAMA